jgi:(S)-2-hydroxy-acid oxidase
MNARTAKQANAILKEATNSMYDAALTWEVLANLRRATTMKIILKGIMAPEDARLAVEHGADAIVMEFEGQNYSLYVMNQTSMCSM